MLGPTLGFLRYVFGPLFGFINFRLGVDSWISWFCFLGGPSDFLALVFGFPLGLLTYVSYS